MTNIEKNAHHCFFRAIAVFTCFLAMMGCSQRENDPALNIQPAPQFELKDKAGKTYTLDDFKGNVTIIHFWASWCPPCIEEIPRWIASAPSFKDLPVKMVAISVDETWEKALSVFPLSKLPSNMVLLLDPTSEVARKYGSKMFPETYILSRDLKTTDKWIGAQDWSGSMVRFGIAKALAKPGNVSNP